MNATPENFKPGERWLLRYASDYALYESVCVEWSPSGDFVKVKHPQVLTTGGVFTQWRGARVGARSVIELLERLPDVESMDNLKPKFYVPLIETPMLEEVRRDVESGNHKTGQASGVEATGGVVAYSRGKLILSLPPAFCEEIEAMLETWRKEQFAKIELGRTFSVIPPEAETKA